MRLRLDLDSRLYEALVAASYKEYRPLDWQALVLLRRALGLPEGEPAPAATPPAAAPQPEEAAP